MRRSRVPGMLKPSNLTPACKQCLDANSGVLIDPITNRPFHQINGTENVVKFMGAWACRIHYKIKNSRYVEEFTLDDTRKEWELRELFPNRAHRRQHGRGHVVA